MEILELAEDCWF